MGAVDRKDQVLHSYTALRKTMKWPTKLFLYTVQVAVYDAFCLAKKRQKGYAGDFLTFLENVSCN